MSLYMTPGVVARRIRPNYLVAMQYSHITQHAHDLVTMAIAQPDPLTVAVESEAEAVTLLGIMIVNQGATEHGGLEVHGDGWSIVFTLPAAA